MMRRWRADGFAASVTAIDLDDLRARNIAGIIIDLDNTLVAYRVLEPSVDEVRWVRAARDAGFRIVVVTNNATPWAKAVADNLGVPCIANAGKPFPRAFRRALVMLELAHDQVVVVGDQFFTDVLGAKAFGLPVILVPPLGDRDPWNTRPLRWIARLLGAERR